MQCNSENVLRGLRNRLKIMEAEQTEVKKDTEETKSSDALNPSKEQANLDGDN